LCGEWLPPATRPAAPVLDGLAPRVLAAARSVADELRPQAGPTATLGLDHSLERDFGVDSLARVELITRISHDLGVTVGEAALTETETPRDLLRFITIGGDTAVLGPGAETLHGPQPRAAQEIPLPHAAQSYPPDSVKTLVEVFDWHLRQHPQRVLITLYGEGDARVELSYADLHRDAVALAAGLHALGLAKGESVAIMLPTGREFFAAFFGVLLAGAVPVPLYPPALASLPTFTLLRERAIPTLRPGDLAPVADIRATLARLLQTWLQARRYRDLRSLLICCVSYQAGISVVITLTAVYAEQVPGFKQADTMLLVFLVNIAAVAGAFTFGHWQDRFGHKRTLGFTLVDWIVMSTLAAMATRAAMFWLAAVIAGLCMGASQSAGRAIVGLFTPPERRAEFFGLWSFAIHLSVVIGPQTYGLLNWLSGGNHRAAILSTALVFAVGLWLLRPVDMARGQMAARALTRHAQRRGFALAQSLASARESLAVHILAY